MALALDIEPHSPRLQCFFNSPLQSESCRRQHCGLAISARDNYTASLQRTILHARSGTANNMSPIRSVAVLGGGISGMATAYYLAQRLPRNIPITLYESSSRLGGYIESSTHTLKESGNGPDNHVIFEKGPRSLRVGEQISSVNMFDLIRRIDLLDELIVIPKTSAAAKNRYIYYSGKINKIPYSLTSILRFYFSQPLFRGMLPQMIWEPFRRNKPAAVKEADDESIGSFFSRRFGSRLTDRLMSAVLHGIYAGDIYKLSVKSLMGYVWKREKAMGSVIALRGPQLSKPPSEYAARHKNELDELLEVNKAVMDSLKGASIVSFRSGMQSLIDRLERKLLETPSLTVKYREPVKYLEKVVDGIRVVSEQGSETFSHVFSAIPSRRLAEMTEGPLSGYLANIPSVSVNVVNLFYQKPKLLPITGFGYLLPRAIPRKDNPEYALGVVFDSDTVSLDHGEGKVPGSFQDSIDGTKLTVMLGGHWWDTERQPVTDETEAIALSTQLIARQLGVTEQPYLAQATFQELCIPQYVVGHQANLQNVHNALRSQFDGRLIVVGASYLGVSVNDCVYYSRVAVDDVVDGRKISGLESRVLEEA